MARNLNTQMVIAMSAMALTAFALMNLGCYLYYAVLYDWLYPGSTATDVWSVSDFAVLGIILAAGGGAMGVRLGTPLENAPQPLPMDAATVDLSDRDAEFLPGEEPNLRALQITVGLVWRALILWMILLLLLSSMVWLG